MAAIQPSPSRTRARRRRRRTLVASSMLLASKSSALEVHENRRRAIDLSNNAFASPILQAASSCIAGQAELRLTLNTDAHSVEDNSWRITKPSSVGQKKSEVVGSGSVESDDAVLASSACLDVSQEHECWDFEFHDDFGDGLTSPHSKSGGTPGSFTLHFNDQLIVSHTTIACLVEDVDGKFNKCASEQGFEYCGLRICRNGEAVSVSNLKGSQCSIEKRQCSSSSTLDAFQVLIDTDGYSEDISWDLRDTVGNLVMSGGDPAILGTLARPGSVEFDNFESFHSSVCLSQDTCYDFRAYDVYGDGISCGANGSISLSFPGGKTLLQQDKDVANLQRLEDGTKTMACMDKKEKTALQTWSFCNIRVCQDGSIEGLEGNQCSFGDKKLLDPNATGDIVGVGMSLNSDVAIPAKEPCSEGGDCTLAQEFAVTEPDLMTASYDDKDEDQSWAEYYHLMIDAKETNEDKDKPAGSISPNSQTLPHKEYNLSLETFYVDLLSPDAPYKLKYYRPHQMSLAIGRYLLSYLLGNIEGWEDDNAPLHFVLDCDKSSQHYDSDDKRVVECKGDAVFPKPSLPKKRVMNDLIHQAFAGEYHSEFLQFMYKDYAPESYSSELGDNDELTKKEKKEQKLQNKLEQNSEELDTEKDENDILREKLMQEGLTKREWKKEIRNKSDGRFLRSVLKD